ncbi:hypothetical protein HXX76_007253 [Chlamydomonas incerta]|uniref:Uncharacterized protein n=1 Tax=Chlamydomonas incerta TaxID=51695 RepID=A0A835T7F0_CHLIN|nr:hypothetical protein HXX76_007253 [Chlamydomonas incerta]|eukprot:KAG2435169.1 hypothetical protein HXX76_007253 [Chlamydomonas incerta]
MAAAEAAAATAATAGAGSGRVAGLCQAVVAGPGRVAQAETALAAAGGDVRAQAAGAAATCHGVPLALPLPLPLRLALRPAADPFTRHPLPLPLLHPLLRHAVAAGTQAVLDQSAACSHARHIAHCVSTLRQLHAHYRGGDSGPGGTAGATASFRSRRGAAASSAALRKPVSAGAASKGPHELAAAPRVTGSDVSGRGVHHSGGLALAACVLLSLLVQLAAGPVAAAALWRHRTALAGAVEAGAAGAEQMLREQYDWLATATPAGVKLHGELCALAAAAAHGLLSVGRAAARATWPRCWGAAAAAVAAAFGLAGLGGGLALLHDLLLLTAAGPLRLQAAATAALLRRHVGWLAAAWAMMRGGGEATAAARRRRQLRQQAAQQRRAQSGGDGTAGGAPASAAFAAAAAASAGADGGVPISRLETLLGLAPDPGARDEVVVEPLIVGVLLFVPLLALLPSVAAWHLLVASAAAVAAAARAALAAAAGLLRLNPVVMLGWRLARPLDFAGSDVFLQHMPLHPTSHALVAQPPGPTRAHAAGGSAAGGAAGPAVATRRAPQPPVATSAPKLTKRRGRTAPPHTSEYTDRFQDQADEQLGRRPAPGTGGVAMRARGADRSAGGAGSAAADDGDGGSGAGGCARPGTLCFGVTPLPRGAFQVAAGSLREGMQGAWCASGTLGPAAVLLDAARLLAARRL